MMKKNSTAETVFSIILNLKTPDGFEPFGKFFIGNNAEFANDLFLKLKGNRKVDSSAVITLELMETRQGLPINLHIISCSLQDIAENCKLITRETFTLLNLKEL
jgi:hypothetical protein